MDLDTINWNGFLRFFFREKCCQMARFGFAGSKKQIFTASVVNVWRDQFQTSSFKNSSFAFDFVRELIKFFGKHENGIQAT